MAEFKWLRHELVLAAHRAQIREHGGIDGIRDEGLLESALARPKNVAAYNPGCDAADLAAAYIYGIANNHPFVDGNKRVAYAAGEVFMVINGFRATADQVTKYEMMIGVASGALDERSVAEWLRANFSPADRA